MLDTIIAIAQLLGILAVPDTKPPAGGIPIPPHTTGAGSFQ
jgi:hypothetical protein